VLGVAIGTAVLLGALVVGDSVRYSLKQIAISRLGKIQLALNSQNRLFRAELSDDLENQLGYTTVPALILKGIAINSVLPLLGGTRDEGTARTNNIQVFGVDERFWKLRDGEPSNIKLQGDSAIINERLARQINVSSGDEILLKVEKLDLLPRDAPMSLDTDLSVAFRVKIDFVTSDLDIGGFSFQSNQIAPFNVFVPIDLLQEKINQKGRANLLLIGDRKNNDSKSVCTVENANSALRNRWKLADAGLELQTLPEQNMIQLSTSRIFIDPQIASIAKQISPDSIEILTYFVNEIRLGDKATPYSIVTAIDPKYYKFFNSKYGNKNNLHGKFLNPPNPLFQRGNSMLSFQRGNNPLIPFNKNGSISPFSKGGKGDLKRTQDSFPHFTLKNQNNQFILHPSSFIPLSSSPIIINSWLADDLSAKVGDVVQLKYFVFQNNRKLEEQTSSFRISAIVPIQGFANDRTLMPEFPGLANVQNCRDWDPGMPIDLNKIRDKDQSYWDAYRGTPKAFINLKDGQAIWSNRFGNLTAIRYPIDKNYKPLNPPLSPFQKGKNLAIPLFKGGRGDFISDTKKWLESSIKSKIDPASIGLFFQPIREQALSASKPTTDFGQLFLGLSFFLIISAVLLTGLLFVFGVQQRREEIGTLLALGFRSNLTQRLFLSEGIILAVFGSIIGAGIGIFYTKIVLYALSTIWKGAVVGASLRYHAEPITFLFGILAGVIISSLTIWVTLRRQTKFSARELLISGSGIELYKKGKSRLWLWLTIVMFIVSIIILILAGSTGAFFGAGTLMLLGCFGLSYWILSALVDSKGTKHLTLKKVGFRNTIRNRGRSLAIIMLLACGSFLVIAIGANRHDPMKDMGKRSSGTGGFTFYAESTLPVLQNLNDDKERMKYGIDTPDMQDVKFVQIRVHEGSDASCLNLNRVQSPRLLGVNPDELQKRGSFTFAKSLSSDGFLMLKDKPTSSDVRTINAIGDSATITWGLGSSVGDTMIYTDEKGQNFQIRIVGALANSILQGSFLISEENFITLFPSESGYRTFLIDAPLNKLKDISKDLSRSFRDVGMELTPTSTRLAEFNAVQNTYLYIFQMLGGLALILGSVGLGIVVLRNVMERRSELALLRAVGFGKRSILWFLLSEHWALLLMGEIFGTITGLIAVLPSLTLSGTGIPYISLIVTMIAVFVSGLIWTWLATKLALRSELLPALRNE
jgi:ABC-type lipoprotein release transport system permease subunit